MVLSCSWVSWWIPLAALVLHLVGSVPLVRRFPPFERGTGLPLSTRTCLRLLGAGAGVSLWLGDQGAVASVLET